MPARANCSIQPERTKHDRATISNRSISKLIISNFIETFSAHFEQKKALPSSERAVTSLGLQRISLLKDFRVVEGDIHSWILSVPTPST
jgi:hypothetical protein